MSTFNIIDKAGCAKNIARIKKAGKAIQELIHTTAVSTLAHIRDHGDYTLAVQLLDALPNGQRVKALAHWYNHFSDGAAKFSFDPKAGWSCKLAKHRKAEQFDVDGAYAVSFADLTTEKAPGTLDIKGVLAYLKRKANDNKTYDDGTPRVSEDARNLMAALYNRAVELTESKKVQLADAA